MSWLIWICNSDISLRYSCVRACICTICIAATLGTSYVYPSVKVHFTNSSGRWFTLVGNTDRWTLFDVLVLCVFATVVVDVTVVIAPYQSPDTMVTENTLGQLTYDLTVRGAPYVWCNSVTNFGTQQPEIVVLNNTSATVQLV